MDSVEFRPNGMLNCEDCPYCQQTGARCPTHEAIYQRCIGERTDVVMQRMPEVNAALTAQDTNQTVGERQENVLSQQHLSLDDQQKIRLQKMEENDRITLGQMKEDDKVKNDDKTTLEKQKEDEMLQALDLMSMYNTKKEKRQFGHVLRKAQAAKGLPDHLDHLAATKHQLRNNRIQKKKDDSQAKKRERQRSRRQVKAQENDQQTKTEAIARAQRKAESKAALDDVKASEKEQLAEWKAEKERIEAAHAARPPRRSKRLRQEAEMRRQRLVLRNDDNLESEGFLARACTLLEETLAHENLTTAGRNNLQEVLSLVNTSRLLGSREPAADVKREPVEEQLHDLRMVLAENEVSRKPSPTVKQESVEEDVMQDA